MGRLKATLSRIYPAKYQSQKIRFLSRHHVGGSLQSI
jgi:hypothetical protein